MACPACSACAEQAPEALPGWRPLRKWGLAVAAAAWLAGAAVAAPLGQVPLSALPAEAQQTERLIRAGGPFPYGKDGTVFGNRERLLPLKPRGHYREYTVRTPGSRDRGARRIVCGGWEPREPEACFYTEDHYASFRRIVPGTGAAAPRHQIHLTKEERDHALADRPSQHRAGDTRVSGR